MKKNIIINGNSIQELEKIPADTFDLIFADPPYWMRTEGTLLRVEGTEFQGCNDKWDSFSSLEEYENFTENWLKACMRVLKPNGSIWVIGGMQCIYTMGSIMQKLGFWLINDVVWYKKNPTPNFLGTRLNNSHETLIWATKSKKAKYTFNYKTAKVLNTDTVSENEYKKGNFKQMGSVWKFSVCTGNERVKDEDGAKLHNTQKPLDLLKRIIAISTKPGDLVLDPFGGTMTTAVAAKELGRDYITIELDEKYCKYGQKRLDNTEYECSDVAVASYDKKPLKVTVSQMIEDGFLHENEFFSFKDGEPVAKLQKDGKLLFANRIFDMHSCAAIAKNVKASRLNGFDYWFVKRQDELISLSKIREQYRKFKGEA